MKRRKFTTEFKKKVALEAIKERKTLHEIASEFKVAPTQVTRWKSELINGAGGIFESGPSEESKQVRELESEQSNLHQTIGKLTVEVDFLKKKLNHLA